MDADMRETYIELVGLATLELSCRGQLRGNSKQERSQTGESKLASLPLPNDLAPRRLIWYFQRAGGKWGWQTGYK